MSYEELRTGRWSAAGHVYFVTTVTAERAPYFRDLACGRLVVHEMWALEREGCVHAMAWVLMPDHLHWLFELADGADLARVMKRLKARSARSVNAFLGRAGGVWQRAYYDHALRREEDLRDTARYIVANPLRAGLVKRLGDYPLWDAIWL